MTINMTREDFQAYREARARQEARYAERWDYVHNGSNGSREAYSYLRKNSKAKNADGKIALKDAGFKAIAAYRDADNRFARALGHYEFAESLEAEAVEGLWMVYENEGVSLDLFVGAIRETVFDGEKVTMSKLNRHIENSKQKALKYELAVTIAELFRQKGWEVA